ncbi:MAG: GntR family transcriptional regulator [Proteobacteria bacterium]|nr:GntR family transcriptional regulator [Pseudomonadota bacterium]MBU1582894.1 GntR family transcriptional regulator [Pseudomonadota bacterium]MBU2451995.1 GntR family transcriptional regulator [Pseudomonadota bacterium]MBU2630618.1 GntR family transcriptional regulator [Pseudomonadota bacterium]
MLNPQSPVPLYHQLADILSEQIRSGTYKPGNVIPSETHMAKQYGIGRPTVRQALDTLVKKGLVERKRGSGTFVKQKAHPIDLFSLAGTSQAFLESRIDTTSKHLEKVFLKEICDDKNNPFNGKTAFFLSRLTLVKKDPVLLEEFYFFPQLFPGLDKMDLDNRSLSQVVSDHYYLKPKIGHQTFKISFLPETMASILGLTKNDPVLEVERTLSFPGADKAVFSRMYCRTDQFVFSQTIGLETT